MTHYYKHNLNLSISASVRIHLVDTVIESYKSTIFYFKLSPKKETFLNYIADIIQRQILLGMCKARWLERDLAYEHFYLALPFIVEALEIINSSLYVALVLKWDLLKRGTQKVGIIKQNVKQRRC